MTTADSGEGEVGSDGQSERRGERRRGRPRISPPTLKAPWKRGISGRSTATSMSWAAAFIDTSHVP